MQQSFPVDLPVLLSWNSGTPKLKTRVSARRKKEFSGILRDKTLDDNLMGDPNVYPFEIKIIRWTTKWMNQPIKNFNKVLKVFKQTLGTGVLPDIS